MTHAPSTSSGLVKLTTAELERFHENAPAALTVRGAGFIFERVACSAETVLMGVVPLVGMLASNWSPHALSVFLLAGVWTAIVCDCLKYAALHAAVAREAHESERNRRVWLVVDMLRRKQQVREVIVEYRPYAGLLADVIAGSVATTVLVVGLLTSSSGAFGLLFHDMGFVLSLVGFVAYQLTLTVWIVLDHQFGSGRKRPLGINGGWRGIGLLLLMTLVLLIQLGPKDQAPSISAKTLVLIADGWFILLGGLNSLNMVHVLRETAWLRAYLRQRRGGKSRRQRRKRRLVSRVLVVIPSWPA